MPPRTKKADQGATAAAAARPVRKRAASSTALAETEPPVKRVTRTRPQEATIPQPKPKRRSHAQVLADTAQKQADLKALLTQMEDNYRKLAEIKVDEEDHQDHEDNTRIENLDDLKEPSDEDDSSSQDVLDTNDMDLDDVDLDGVDESVKNKSLKHRDLKPRRGETSLAVAEIREELQAERKTKKLDIGESGKTQKSNIGDGGNRKGKGKKKQNAVDSTTGKPLDDTGLGGLNDEDLIAEMPAPVRSNKAEHFNELIKVTIPKTRKPAATPVRTASKSATTQTMLTQTTNTASKTSKALPEFMVAVWNTRGTDTAYGLMYSNPQPFIQFAKGPKLLEEVQKAVEGLWPRSDYEVKKGDALHEKFYDRCTEARSKVGSKAQAVVEAFFAQDIYAESAAERQGYALYALQKDGPLLYQNPAPRNTKSNDPDYKAPTGSFLSDHVVQVVKVFIPHYARSALEHGIPVGLLGMAAAGLERAFRMYTSTGNKTVCAPGFTLPNVNNAVEAYAQSASNMTQSHWKKLKDLCGISTAEMAIPSMEERETFEISASRHLMYDASSPPPKD
ncbi:hypothetical protein EV361DRAFT_966491 [Lentinula raphanica]|nr:hypothetical protein EV361DRAFT_966491 [Lentinula raphanica]